MFLAGQWYEQDKMMILSGRLIKKLERQEFYIELNIFN